MKTMKKTLSVFLSVLLVFALLAACGESSPSDSTPGNNSDNSGNPTPGDGGNDSNTPASSFDASRIIGVFTREEGSGTRDAFTSVTGVGEDMYEEAVEKSETNEIIAGVEGNDYAIGYVSLGSLNDKIKALNIGGVAPSSATVKDGSYPIQRPFLVCVNDEKKDDALVQDFISFILSAEGQEVAASKWITYVDGAPAYTPSGLSGTIRVGGSTSVDPMMVALKDKYIAHNPDVKIEISGGGSGTGISEATSGVIDIGMSSRALKDSEKEGGLTDYIIALDGVAVIVNTVNPIDGMTMEQVKDIFTGEVTKWSDVR